MWLELHWIVYSERSPERSGRVNTTVSRERPHPHRREARPAMTPPALSGRPPPDPPTDRRWVRDCPAHHYPRLRSADALPPSAFPHCRLVTGRFPETIRPGANAASRSLFMLRFSLKCERGSTLYTARGDVNWYRLRARRLAVLADFSPYLHGPTEAAQQYASISMHIPLMASATVRLLGEKGTSVLAA